MQYLLGNIYKPDKHKFINYFGIRYRKNSTFISSPNQSTLITAVNGLKLLPKRKLQHPTKKLEMGNEYLKNRSTYYNYVHIYYYYKYCNN